MYKSEEDGITHINIYSKGNTELGRLLSNFSVTYIENKFGTFKSIEGLIYYCGSENEELKFLHGWRAKFVGQKSKQLYKMPENEFRNLIIDAMNQKVENHSRLKKLLKESVLPFAHYYNYGGKLILVKGWEWQIKEWENIRLELQCTK